MCLLAGLFAVQETAKTGQKFPVASAEHSSCFQKVIQEAFVCFESRCIMNIVADLLTEVDIFGHDALAVHSQSIICGYCLFSF